MDAVAKPEVVGRVSRDVEALGVGVVRGIAVRRGEQSDTDMPFLDRLATDLQSLLGHATREMHRTCVAKQFFHSGWKQRRVVSQALHLCWIAEEGQHAAADEVRGGL